MQRCATAPALETRPARALWGVALGLALGVALSGCSQRQLYNAGQQWQANECRKLPPAEQQRCRSSNAMSFEQYQREAAQAKGSQ